MNTIRTLARATMLALTCVLSAVTPTYAEPADATSAQFEPAELEQMLAPVALYPDTVLTHILIAATYPLEVVQATRWTRANRDLTGEAAVEAAADKKWDPSVKALVAFPQILSRMNEDLEWTEQLGQAFGHNEKAVMDAIQNLRQRAYTEGNLESLEHIQVQREKDMIVIEPAVREVVYIPYYDTRVIYGDWRWRDYPPLYWDIPTHHVSYRPSHSRTRIYWSSGVRVPSQFFFSSFHWHARQVIVVNVQHYDRYPYYSSRQIIQHRDAYRWRYDPHRRDWGYRDNDRNYRYGDPRFGSPNRGRHIGHPTTGNPGSGYGRPATPARPPVVSPPSQPTYSPRPGRHQPDPGSNVRKVPRGRYGENHPQSQQRVKLPERDLQTPGGATRSSATTNRSTNRPAGRPLPSADRNHKQAPGRPGS